MFTEKALWIEKEIFSIITMPEKPAEKWVVFCPGTIIGTQSAPETGPTVAMARKLANKGVASVRFDFRGKGNSYGDCKRFGYDTAEKDINDMLKYIKKEYNSNNIRIYGKGGSGYISGKIALQDKDISKALLYEPILSPAVAKVKGFNDNIYNLDKNEFGILKGVRVFGRHTKIMETLPSFDELDITNNHCNLLIIIGREDEMSPSALIDKTIKKMKDEGINCEIKDKPPHDMTDEATLDYLENQGVNFLAM